MADNTYDLYDSAGAAIRGVSQTATFSTEAIDVSGYDRFGLILSYSSVTGTVDVTVQTSLDAGATWLAFYPADENTETAASMTQVSATGVTAKYWDRALAASRSGRSPGGEGLRRKVHPMIKFVFTIVTGPITLAEINFMGLKY